MRLLVSLLVLFSLPSEARGQGYLSNAAEHGFYLMHPLSVFNGAVFNSSVTWSQPVVPGTSDPGFSAYLDAARTLRGELQTRLGAVRTARDTTLVAAFRMFHASLSSAITADAGDAVPARERFQSFRAIVQPVEQQLAAAVGAFRERFAARFADHACVRAAALLEAVDGGTVSAGESFRGAVLTRGDSVTRAEWVAYLPTWTEVLQIERDLEACKGAPWGQRTVFLADGNTTVEGTDFDPAGSSAPAGPDGPTGTHVRIETRTTRAAGDDTRTGLIRFRGAIR